MLHRLAFACTWVSVLGASASLCAQADRAAPRGLVTAILLEAPKTGRARIECSARGVERVDAASGALVARFDLPTRCFTGVAHSAGFLFAGGEAGKRGVVHAVDAKGRCITSLEVADDVVVALARHRDLLAVASADGSVVLVRCAEDLSALRVERRLPSHRGGASAVAFDATGRFFASGGRDGVVRLHDFARESLEGTATCREIASHTGAVLALAFAENGELYSSSADAALRVHDSEGRLLRSWLRIARDLRAMVVLADQVVLAGGDGRLHCIDRRGDGRNALAAPGGGRAEALCSLVLEPESGLAFAGTRDAVLRFRLSAVDERGEARR